MLNSLKLLIRCYLTQLVHKRYIIFQFNQFLDSRAEIHQILWLFFGKFRTLKSLVILKLADPTQPNIALT